MRLLSHVLLFSSLNLQLSRSLVSLVLDPVERQGLPDLFRLFPYLIAPLKCLCKQSTTTPANTGCSQISVSHQRCTVFLSPDVANDVLIQVACPHLHQH